MPSSTMSEYTLCMTDADVEDAVNLLSTASHIFLDCEGRDLGNVGGALSLIQLGTPGASRIFLGAQLVDFVDCGLLLTLPLRALRRPVAAIPVAAGFAHLEERVTRDERLAPLDRTEPRRKGALDGRRGSAHSRPRCYAGRHVEVWNRLENLGEYRVDFWSRWRRWWAWRAWCAERHPSLSLENLVECMVSSPGYFV